ncbi:MAG: hypothetical protein GY915_04905 [bacterium]|nr:hypothetical protein [bacterium]
MSFCKIRTYFVFLVCLIVSPAAFSAPVIKGIEQNENLLKILEITGISHDGTLKDILEKTQESWLRRGERWETQNERFEPLKEELWPFLVGLGHVEDFFPKEKKYDAVLVLGATHDRMCLRFGHAMNLWKQGIRFDQITFFVGERDLRPETETEQVIRKEAALIPFRADWEIHTETINLKTETDSAKFIYAAADLPPGMREIPCIFVDTPRRHKSRPNTADTFKEWLRMLPSDFPKEAKVLVISNQPYVPYQYAVSLNEISKNGFQIEGREGEGEGASNTTDLGNIHVDVTGVKIDPGTPVLIVLDAIARRLWVTHKYLNRNVEVH